MNTRTIGAMNERQPANDFAIHVPLTIAVGELQRLGETRLGATPSKVRQILRQMDEAISHTAGTVPLYVKQHKEFCEIDDGCFRNGGRAHLRSLQVTLARSRISPSFSEVVRASVLIASTVSWLRSSFPTYLIAPTNKSLTRNCCSVKISRD
jgi:hypothetical protein